MIHSSDFKPRVYPVFADIGHSEIDRLQELTASTALNRTRLEEIGRDGTLDWKKQTPTVSLSLRQLEYGSIEFWRKLANKGDSVSTINVTDFSTSAVDIAAFKTDDNGTFLGTLFYPKQRLAGFGLNIGDPNAIMERSFSLVGEDEIMLQNANKYLIAKRAAMSGGTNETITISDPAPVLDPDESGKYLFKVVRVRSGLGTELLEPGDWSYNGSGTLTINGLSVAGDVILYWYSAGAMPSGESTFVENDADLTAVSADQCSIYLQTNTYVYRLQSVSIDSSFDRQDVKEIGNDEVVARGVRQITNRITLGRILEQWTVEEILRGVSGLSYGKIDPRKFQSNMNLIVKIYSDSDKTQFKMGYKFLELAPTSLDGSTPVNDYVNRNAVLEGESAFVTTNESLL